MNVLFLMCNNISAGDDSMNVCLRTVKELRFALQAEGHKCEYVSIISEANPECRQKFHHFKNMKWDWLIRVHTSGFIHIDKTVELLGLQPQAKIGWLTTEYDLGRHSQFEPYDAIFANFVESYYQERFKDKFYKNFHMLNFNALVLDQRERTDWSEKSGDMSVLYYGRYRPNRETYFRKYFDHRMLVSTSKRNVSKFKALGLYPRYYDLLSWRRGRESLNQFRHHLYIEDTVTHTHFNNLANRFYEGITCDVLPLFDRSCEQTVLKSNYVMPDDLFIDSVDDMWSFAMNTTDRWRKNTLDSLKEQAVHEKRTVATDFIKVLDAY